MAELTLNNAISNATGTTPFYINYGKNPNIISDLLDSPRAEKGVQYATELETVHKQITMNIEKVQKIIERNENKHKKKGPQFKKGDKVWLYIKNLKTKRPNKKLDYVKVGPFFIKSIKGPVNYKLELPTYAKIHPVFHISLLEKAANNILISEKFIFEPKKDAKYEVEKILKK